MDYNLETWKGSCGYSAPGRTGISGNDGNSIHFSSIDSSTDASTIKERIRTNKSLSNNPDAITDEQYKPSDYILDMYGQLVEISGINGNVVTLVSLGNIAFPEKQKGYEAPSHSGTTQLRFTFKPVPTYPPYTDIDTGFITNENAYIQRKQTGTVSGEAWKLWRYRYYGNKSYSYSYNIPKGYNIVPDPDPYTLTWRDDNGDSSTFTSTKSFIEYIVNNEEYCKICAVLNSGIVIESIPTENNNFGIFIEKGYIESIDNNLTTLNQYASFQEEIDASVNKNEIVNTLKTGQSNTMCNMYFEYSHNGELYRLDINVI